jgi:hypothetical protein
MIAPDEQLVAIEHESVPAIGDALNETMLPKPVPIELVAYALK